MITNKTQIDNNTYEVEFSASADQLKIEKQRVYRKEVRKYNVPGFRKGKAPLSVIERMYGPVFTQEAVETVYQSAIDEAIAEFGMEVVDANSGEVVSLEGDVAFKAKFVVKPEVKIEGYKGLSVEKAEPVITDEDVEHELHHVQERNSRSVKVEDRPGEQCRDNRKKQTISRKSEFFVPCDKLFGMPLTSEDFSVKISSIRHCPE